MFLLAFDSVIRFIVTGSEATTHHILILITNPDLTSQFSVLFHCLIRTSRRVINALFTLNASL